MSSPWYEKKRRPALLRERASLLVKSIKVICFHELVAAQSRQPADCL